MTVPPHRAIQSSLPSWYRGDQHAVVHFSVIGAATLGCLAAVVAWRPAALALVLVLVPVWSVLEYAIHRWVLHAIRGVWPPLSRDHAVHHAYFPAHDMFFATHHDVYRVLLRPLDVVAVEGIVALVCGILALASVDVALAAAASANLYLLLYEVAHAGSHLESWAKHPLFRESSRHHRVHHAEIVSGRAFANVFPWVDRLFRT